MMITGWKTDWLVTCKECRMNMVPHDRADETCDSCRDTIRQRREWERGNCKVCRMSRAWVGNMCFNCRLDRNLEESRKKKKGWWLW